MAGNVSIRLKLLDFASGKRSGGEHSKSADEIWCKRRFIQTSGSISYSKKSVTSLMVASRNSPLISFHANQRVDLLTPLIRPVICAMHQTRRVYHSGYPPTFCFASGRENAPVGLWMLKVRTFL